MAKYIAYQIYIGKLDMDEAIAAYPNIAAEIQKYYEEFNQEAK